MEKDRRHEDQQHADQQHADQQHADQQRTIPGALRSLLVPGTPPDVAERYARLPELAGEAQLSLVEVPVVVVDVETTGVDPSRCRLIEISAQRLVAGEACGTFTTLVDPGRHIPAEITELTGITDADVKGAPSPSEGIAEFARFAGEDDLVAHNARFDRDFIMAEAPAGTCSGAWIDTLALSQILLPRLSSHRLADLACAFGIAAQPSHRAGDDVAALVGLWRILTAALTELPAGFAGYIAALSPETDWALRPLFSQAAGLHPGIDFSLRQARASRVGAALEKAKFDACEVPLSFATNDEVAEAFSPEGLVGRMCEGYEQRSEQADMAIEVLDALRSGGFRVLEAGTGVGKSMAYLVPLALAAKGNAVCMGVATKTNALMDQLVYHELPRLAHAMGGLDYVALKGYDHYPCLRKVEALAHREGMGRADIEALAALASFVEQTAWGDLDALNLHWPGGLRNVVQASPNDCLKSRCPFYPKRCYLHGARRHAASADIVVTNHALLFRDAQMDNGILPPIRHWVVDEAHAVEAEARKQLSCSVTARGLDNLLQRLATPRSGIIEAIRSKAPQLEGGGLLYGVTADADERAGKVIALSTSFFSTVKDLAGASSEAGSSYDRMTLWVGSELRASGSWSEVERLGRSLADKLDGLVQRLRDLTGILEEFEGVFSVQQADLANVTCELNGLLDALVLVLDGEDESYVYSVELDRNPDACAEALCAQKLDIGEVLACEFYPRVESVVFTSATLATGDEKAPFGHFLRTSGLSRMEEGRVAARQLASSYDFDRHMSILLPDDIPEPNTSGYVDALAELLLEVHRGMGGSVLTLFTNRREMEELYRRLKPELRAQGIDLIAQTRKVTAKGLRDRFLKERELSLFALKSFWEGFDAPGETLRCVVVTKLPFARPTDPLSCERKRRCGHAAWRRYALPEAVVELKQAAGRLIRSSTDEGWLVLADARLQTKSYGKDFLRALPTRDVRIAKTPEIARILREGHPGMEA